MFCYNCGKEINNANFCPFCGTKVYAPLNEPGTNEKTSTTDGGLSDFAGPMSSSGIFPENNGFSPDGAQAPETSGISPDNMSAVDPAIEVDGNFSGDVDPSGFGIEGNDFGTDQNNAAPAVNTGAQGFNLTAYVGLRTGKGITILSMANSGKLTVTPAGVSYTIVMGGKSKSHSYTFGEIAETKFTMSHSGLQPLFAYTVTLKDARKYIYTYVPFQRSKLNSIDAVIHQNMR